MTLRVAYQGAPGAYSEEMARALFPSAELCPQHAFADVFGALESAYVEAAVLPVENSIAGAVVDVYDLLRQHRALTIAAEAILRVRHCLVGVAGARLEGVRVARSHPQALAQCEPWLRAHGIEPEVAYDTAGAAAEVAARGDASIGAVASRRAAERNGLAVLAEDIAAGDENYTRFFALVRRDDGSPRDAIPAALRAGAAKTSLVFAIKDRPGALVLALQPFAAAGVNLAKIESRPSRAAPWDYVFYLDLHGDPAESPTREALSILRRSAAWVELLGTYPMAGEPL
jgi:prephenate dehydratase